MIVVADRGGVGERQAEIVVEADAVQRWEDGDAVFVRDGEEYEARPVTLGVRAEGVVEVLSGLAAGEKIVVNGLQRVRPGTKVTPQTETAPAEKR